MYDGQHVCMNSVRMHGRVCSLPSHSPFHSSTVSPSLTFTNPSGSTVLPSASGVLPAALFEMKVLRQWLVHGPFTGLCRRNISANWSNPGPDCWCLASSYSVPGPKNMYVSSASLSVSRPEWRRQEELH